MLPAVGRCGCINRAGRFWGGDAKARSVEVEGGAKPGKQGQVGGAVTIGVPSDAASTVIAIIRMDMAQWCAPWRRQQGGRRDSSLAERTAASGPSQKSRIRKMETNRRILILMLHEVWKVRLKKGWRRHSSWRRSGGRHVRSLQWWPGASLILSFNQSSYLIPKSPWPLGSRTRHTGECSSRKRRLSGQITGR